MVVLSKLTAQGAWLIFPEADREGSTPAQGTLGSYVPTEKSPKPHGKSMELLFFLFGPLMLLVVLVCADARGEPTLQRLSDGTRGGLRYVALLAFIVTLVGVLAAVPRRTPMSFSALSSHPRALSAAAFSAPANDTQPRRRPSRHLVPPRARHS
jgi:hypothetical protein